VQTGGDIGLECPVGNRMATFDASRTKRTVTKTYGRGNLLGLLSPFLAMFMVSAGMHGSRDAAAREMEDDAVAMARRGYRVVSSRERSLERFGISWYEVTYELVDPPAA
jgi:hypothetical protein